MRNILTAIPLFCVTTLPGRAQDWNQIMADAA